MPAQLEQFESAYALIDEAQEGVDDFLSALVEFERERPAQWLREEDPSTNKILLKLAFEPPSSKIRRQAYRVVNDCRHALDQAVFAGTTLISPTGGKKTYFPFASDPAEFEDLFTKKRNCADVAPELKAVLRGFEPWWPSPNHIGGNFLLRTLGKISGPNKHQVPVSTMVQAYPSKVEFSTEHPVEFRLPPEKVEGKNEFVIAYLPRHGLEKLKVEARSHYMLAGIPELHDKAALAIFCDFIALTSRIVQDIEATVVSLTSPPA
ncbi:hypothetical protein KGO5_01753 [Sinorhizobium sp. KGO-5]|uniref:hypothetical protein n=1 Tax=Sinorhizobium sp. KGO-5 TaxID=1470810 RepID=UPI00294A1178|nr:hypothetical protein KGO5_01753 [Sinorhizobium sp. KGO-5]